MSEEKKKGVNPEELYRKALTLEKRKKENWALQLMTQAAELGHAEAQLHLGYHYMLGPECQVDRRKAFCWFSRAMDAGAAEAFYHVAMFYHWSYLSEIKRSERKCFSLLHKGAMLGDALCMSCVAECYESGTGVRQNYSKALVWYKRYSKKTDYLYHAEAYSIIGDYYYEGRGVERDYVKAVAWYAKAVDADWSKGYYKLGLCYMYGTGVAKNLNKAKELLKIAAMRSSYQEEAEEKLRELEEIV